MTSTKNWQRSDPLTHASTWVNYREPISLYRGCWASTLVNYGEPISLYRGCWASTLVNYREPISLYRGCWASTLVNYSEPIPLYRGCWAPTLVNYSEPIPLYRGCWASTLVNYSEPILLYRGYWTSVLSHFPLTRLHQNFLQFLQTLFKALQHELLSTEKLTQFRSRFLNLLKRFFFWGYRKATLAWNVLTKIKI